MTSTSRVSRLVYIATLIPHRHRYGIDFAADKKAQGFLDPICMGMWEKSIPYRCPCGISVAVYGRAHTRRWRHDVLNQNYHRMTAGFHICVERRFKFSNACNLYLWTKTNTSMHCLSWNKRNILITKLVGFVELFIFRHFVPTIPCGKWEKRALFLWQSIVDFRWRQENASPRVHRYSGKFGSCFV